MRNSTFFIRFSNSYFWYFAVLGLVVPFMGVFLDGRGFSSKEIGEIVAMFTLTRILGPGVWASLADKTGKLVEIVRFGAALAVISFVVVFGINGYWSVAIILSLFTLFWSAILPQLEVMTLSAIKRSPKIYSRIRLWGSIGFIFASVLGGKAVELYGSEVFAVLLTSVLVALLFSTFFLRQRSIKSKSQIVDSGFLSKVNSIGFVLFMLSGLMLQISFGPFYGFYALFLQDLGYGGGAIGLLISVGVLAEIAIFFWAGKILVSIPFYSVMLMCFGFTALRWFVTGNFGDSLTLLVLSQCLHALSFGLYHCASIQFIQRYFNVNQQSRGQAIYNSGVYGIGGAIGAYLAGLLWQDGQGAVVTFDLAAIAALAAMTIFIFYRWTREYKTCC